MRSKARRFEAFLGSGVVFLFGVMFVGQAGAQTVTVISADADLVDVFTITTDGTHLYVGGSDSDVPSEPRIWRIPIGGGAATRLYTGWGLNTCCTAGLALFGNDVFWIDPNSGPVTDTEIFRAPKDGSGPITPIYTGVFVGQPIVDGSDITTDGRKLYTADFVQGRVHSVNTDGGGITQLGPNRYGGFFEREHRNLIAEDVGVLYIGDLGQPSFGDTPPRVQSIPSAGGAFTTLFLGPTFTSRGWGGLAVGNNTIFLTEGNNILQMPVAGGTPTLLVSDPKFKTLQGITFFNNALYVADNGNLDTTNGPGKIWKVDLSTVIAGSLDIKPGKCPNEFKPRTGRSGHTTEISLVGTQNLDVTDVDLSSILLSRVDDVGGSVAPDRVRVQDRATPFEGEPWGCHKLRRDGIDDLRMGFFSVQMTQELQLDQLPEGTVLELVVTGNLLDGTPFVASDWILIGAVRAR